MQEEDGVPARPPLTTRCKKQCETLERCAYRPHGEKVVRKSDVRHKPLVEVVCLLNGHPALHPRPIHYNVQVGDLLSLLEANFPPGETRLYCPILVDTYQITHL